MRDVVALADPRLEGRATGSPGGVRARGWIVERFREIGITPAGTDGYRQPFVVTSPSRLRAVPEAGSVRTPLEAANVVGKVSGRDLAARSIVVTAHYDHLGVHDGIVYPGADDNASGVAVLLAAAQHFRRIPPRHTMVFAALDAEEVGLHGAKALVASPVVPRGRVELNVNLDMVSRSSANEIYAAGTYHTPWLTATLIDVQRRATVRIRFGHDRPEASSGGLEDWTLESDHGVFHAAGIPFIYFGVEDHPDYHKPTDTADRIDLRFFGDVADMIVEAIRTFDEKLR